MLDEDNDDDNDNIIMIMLMIMMIMIMISMAIDIDGNEEEGTSDKEAMGHYFTSIWCIATSPPSRSKIIHRVEDVPASNAAIYCGFVIQITNQSVNESISQ